MSSRTSISIQATCATSRAALASQIRKLRRNFNVKLDKKPATPEQRKPLWSIHRRLMRALIEHHR
jgi:hypothetical protein